MQKVVIVNLNGIAYHLEERAYAALGEYLNAAEAQLRENPDRREIVGDLEQAIAEKFSRFLSSSKNVVSEAEMTTILTEMGPVRDDAAEGDASARSARTSATSADAAAGTDRASAAGSQAGSERTDRSTARRLYLMLDTGYIGGVCSGIAAFLDADVTLVRIAVALLALFEVIFLHTPFVVLAYLVAMFVIPVADTSEERAAARGIPFNAQQLIDEAKRNLGRIGEHDWKHTRRQWRQQRRWERKYMRQMKRTYTWSWPPPAIGPATYGSQVAAGFITPVLTLISVAAFWAMLYIGVSLASTGAVHGWQLPANLPLWLALVALLFLYNAVIWPLHAVRRASYYRLGGPDHARYEAFDGLMSTLLGVAIVWAGYRYSPEIREWLRHLPDAWHNIVSSFRGV
jgi:phage shock protein PspC (stress-responsive transcriptional regulator)